MINITNIENTLVSWLELAVLGLKVIIANQNKPRPVDPTLYATIHIMQSDPQGVAETDMTFVPDDFSVDVDYSNVEELMVSINTFRAGSYQLATQLKDSLAKVTVHDLLTDGGLGYLRTGGVRDLTIEVNKKLEERGQFDCFFSTRSLESENIETIRKIEVTDELDGSTFQVDHPDGPP